MWFTYLLFSPTINTTYIGITNNLETRLDQHNGLKPGGAKATRRASDWKIVKYIKWESVEVPNAPKSVEAPKILAASFEWYAKHKQNRNGKWTKAIGLESRKKRFEELLKEERFMTGQLSAEVESKSS